MKSRTLSHLLLASLLLLLALSACSSSDSEPAGSSPAKEGVKTAARQNQAFDSCSLLTAADIHEFFPGASIEITKHGSEVSQESLGSRVCFYELSKDDMVFIQTIVYRTRDMNRDLQEAGRTAESNYLASKEYADGRIQVEGLGKDAYYGGSGLRAFSGLHVLVDRDTALNVSVGLGRGNQDDQAHLKIEKALAQKMISRL